MRKIFLLVLGLLLLGGCYYSSSIVSVPVATLVEAGRIDTFFTKQGQHPESALNTLINSSTKTLDIAIYSLTYPSTVKVITDAQKRGVVVRVITDEQQAGGKSQTVALDILLLNGVQVKRDDHSGLMHLKMTIVDGQVATTGSYNYTANATDNNDEMLVIIYDVDFAQKCLGEFNRMWNSSKYVDVKMSY